MYKPNNWFVLLWGQFTYLIEPINIHFLQSMRTTELIDLVMNLVVYPCLIIVYTIIEKSVIHMLLIKAINNLLGTKLTYYNLKESLTQQNHTHHTFVTPCIIKSKKNEKRRAPLSYQSWSLLHLLFHKEYLLPNNSK